MSDHPRTRNCPLPGTFFRRANSLWSCPVCGRIWVLRKNLGLESDPEWQEIRLKPELVRGDG